MLCVQHLRIYAFVDVIWRHLNNCVCMGLQYAGHEDNNGVGVVDIVPLDDRAGARLAPIDPFMASEAFTPSLIALSSFNNI